MKDTLAIAAAELASVPKDAIIYVLELAQDLRDDHAALVSAKDLVEKNGLAVNGEISGKALVIAAELEFMACEHAQRVFGFSHMGGTEEDIASLPQFLENAVRRPVTNVEPHLP